MKKLFTTLILAGAFNAVAYAAAPAHLVDGALPVENTVRAGPGVVPGTTRCDTPGSLTSAADALAYCDAATHTWQLLKLTGAGIAEATISDYHIILPPPPQFVPTKVWDDGKSTYIQLRAPYSGELPAIFAEIEPGQHELLNAQWDEKSSCFVIPNLITRVVMRAGAKYVEIDRTKTDHRATLVR